jgi:hypothetical protein
MSRVLNVVLVLVILLLAGSHVFQFRTREPKMGRISGVKFDFTSSGDYRIVLEACSVVNITEKLVDLAFRIGVENIGDETGRRAAPFVEILDRDGFVMAHSGLIIPWTSEVIEPGEYQTHTVSIVVTPAQYPEIYRVRISGRDALSKL